MVNNLLRCLPVALPVIIAPSTPAQLAFPACWRGEGWFPIPAVLQIRITVDGVEDGDGLLDQALGIEVPLAILLAHHRPGFHQPGGSAAF